MAPPRVSAFKPDQLWQQAREPMFWLDQALRLTWINRAWEGLTGHPAESVVGRTCAAYGPAESGKPADVAASFVPPPEAVAGQPSGSLTVILHASGERLWRRVEFWPFRDHGGALIGILGLVREASAPPSVPDSQAHQLRVRLMELRERLQLAFRCESLIGTGPAHRRLLEQVRLAAASTTAVLIVGESGTGKRLVARTIHHLGSGHHHPLVPIDCEALPAEVIERELFDCRLPAEHFDEEANSLREPFRGRLALAEGSSLLIGDILTLPRDLQARLAESLDGRVRLIATTAGNPEAALKQEQLRQELYYMLSVLVIPTLPLRERRHDLLLLAQTFLEQANQRTGWTCGGFTPQAMSVLQAYDWPGNLSELARVIDAAHDHLRSRTQAEKALPLIDIDDLPASIRGHLGAAYLPPTASPAMKPLDELLTEIERRLIETALSRARQNKSRAAEFLGISRPRLYRRIKELNLPDDSEPENGAVPAASSSPAAP
jgi:DNA-binding NtrC family response regulator